MKGVVIRENGGPGVMKLQQLERPQVKNNEVLIKVAATSINRFDLRQRRGWLPKLKKGESAYPGIECSGEIIAVGAGVTQWKVGDQVCALVNRGGYAEEVVVPSGQLLSVPRSVSLEDAASLPVVACSVWLALFQIGKLSAGQTLLVRDGCSDFGIFAIQIAKYKGAKVLVIGDCKEKLSFCKNLGADVCINTKNKYFYNIHDLVKKETIQGTGVDMVMDTRAANFDENIDCLKFYGKLLIVDLHDQPQVKSYIGYFVAKRIEVQVVDIQMTNWEEKELTVNRVKRYVWPAIEKGQIKPVIYKNFPLSEAANAHKLMENGKFIGKILLLPDSFMS